MFFLKSTLGDEIVLNSIDWLENYPWRQEKSIRTEPDRYEICLLVKDFSPKDISVKTIDGFIVVEAQHDEKKDEHGFISRHFKRRYKLPDECVLDRVESKLSADGVLTIIAPKKVVKKGTVIPVVHQNGPKSKL